MRVLRCLEDHDLESSVKIKEYLIPFLQARIKNLAEIIQNYDTTKSRDDDSVYGKTIDQVIQVHYRQIEDSWVTLINEFKLTYPDKETTNFYENAVAEQAEADQTVMHVGNVDWNSISTKLKDTGLQCLPKLWIFFLAILKKIVET